MRLMFLAVLACCSLGVLAQDSSKTPSDSSPKAGDSSSSPQRARKEPNPNLAPPRSDRVSADSLEPGESSSKDTQIDLSPPPDDAKAHPDSSSILVDEGSGDTDPNAFRYWDPHKAAKDVEVGDYYFKRKNYSAAENRYREALQYKDNDAIATYRLAICLEKLDRPDEARKEYENYLNILPHGPEADAAHKAIDRLKGPSADAKPVP